MTKDDVIQEALNVYHNYNVSMEQAMDIVMNVVEESSLLDDTSDDYDYAAESYEDYDYGEDDSYGYREYDEETAKAEAVEAALDLYHNYPDLTMEECMECVLVTRS